MSGDELPSSALLRGATRRTTCWGVAPVEIAQRLAREVGKLGFSAPITHVYHPLDYAFAAHRVYLERFAKPRVGAVLLGMNPGPWGMAQTGVPFGEITHVKEWLGINETVSAPGHTHPKRPVQGFACSRSEVSGARLWGWAKQRYGTPKAFFERFFVLNYCPLSFMTETARNVTPDKLPNHERKALFVPCDRALVAMVDWLQPRAVVGVGKFAEARAREALAGRDVRIASLLHPSPASPAANRGWAAQAERQLRALALL